MEGGGLGGENVIVKRQLEQKIAELNVSEEPYCINFDLINIMIVGCSTEDNSYRRMESERERR